MGEVSVGANAGLKHPQPRKRRRRRSCESLGCARLKDGGPHPNGWARARLPGSQIHERTPTLQAAERHSGKGRESLTQGEADQKVGASRDG